jgi:TrkA domain protein
LIVLHDDGTRELYGVSPDNPEGRIPMVTLNDDEARRVAAIIGGLIA